MLGFAVMNPQTSFTYFMLIGFLLGIGGGDFSSFMPSTSLFFPKKEVGTALGIQAGVGNFGVSLVQLLSPLIMSLTLFSFLGGGEIIVGDIAAQIRPGFNEQREFVLPVNWLPVGYGHAA